MFESKKSHGWIAETKFPKALYTLQSQAKQGKFPWDDDDKPPVIFWDNYKDHVADLATFRDQQRTNGFCNFPWVIAKHFGITWTDPDQGQEGTCAGFAADSASWCMVLQHLADGVELKFIPTNPYPAWVLGRQDANYNGGGATLSMVLNGINKYGRFPVSDVGSYEETLRQNKNWRNLVAYAEHHQSGCCYLGDLNKKEMADAIILCVRAGQSVVFGGSVAVGSTPHYTNGIKEGILSGSWAHATAFVAYREHQGKVYLAFMNSWGNLYGVGREGEPGSIVWLSEDNVRRMCSGTYSDAFVITYAESAKGKTDWNLMPKGIAI